MLAVEEIQDAVEYVLMQSGYESTAKAYVVYRRHHEELRQGNGGGKLVKAYLDGTDWRKKENATVTDSLSTIG